ncbi:MAG: alanine racemase, partial [Pseudoclavibacter sp.]
MTPNTPAQRDPLDMHNPHDPHDPQAHHRGADVTEPRIEVDLAAVRHNVTTVQRAVDRPLMAIVKAAGYGHGALAVARAALDGGAESLGVADITEGLALRDAGIDAPMLAWLHGPSTDWAAAIEADIDVAVSSIEQLQLAASVAESIGRPARIHAKIDTGLGRNGAIERDWGSVFAHLRDLEAAGTARFAGLFSHLSGASREADLQQVAAFERARALATRLGVSPERCHLGATAGGIDLP